MKIKEDAFAKPVNVSVVTQKVVGLKLATYGELSTIYSLESALDLLEINEVKEYNERIIREVQDELNDN